MESHLKTALNALNEIDFRELEYCIQLASTVRSLIKNHNVSFEYVAESLKLSSEDLICLVKGSYEITLRTISMIHSLNETLELQRTKKNIVPIISFPDYKYTIEKTNE